MRALVVAAALAGALPGCAFLAGEGDESLTVWNDGAQPLTAVISITQNVGEFRVFGESMTLTSGQVREFALALRAGAYTVDVTTSTRVDQRVGIEIPERGDTQITVRFHRAGATITTTSR